MSFVRGSNTYSRWLVLRFMGFIACIVLFLLIFSKDGIAAPSWWVPKFTFIEPATKPQEVSFTVQLFLLFTVLSLVPSIVLMMTSFTRIIVVFAFLRHALGTQQLPPTQIFVGLALFMTAMIMAPVWSQVNKTAITPYMNGKISIYEAAKRMQGPFKTFMLKQTRNKDLALFFQISHIKPPPKREQVPFTVLLPSFVLSELKTAFIIGFMLYVPFLIIDMVVASVLMAMGMMMLPPMMISLPFKLLLFVLVDGWNLLVKSLAASF